MCSVDDFSKHYAILSTNRGKITVYDVSEVILKHFIFIGSTETRESVNILRSQK